MHQRSLKRLLFITLLAGGLAFAGPAQAQAAPFESSQGLWKWLTRAWEEGVTVLWEHPGAEHPTPNENRHRAQQAVCSDPKGCTYSVTPASGGATCLAWNEAGGCIDPNG
jgi:hypothetical protein